MKEILHALLSGIFFGGLLALAATRVLASMLYQTDVRDAPTYGAVAGLLLGVSLLASYLPAQRAVRVDPLEALKLE